MQRGTNCSSLDNSQFVASFSIDNARIQYFFFDGQCCTILCCVYFQCSFSNGGHLFAAVHGNIIQIYSTSTFDNVANLKGHNGKVRAVVWSSDDSKIVSCGMDGAVYEWDTFTGKRVGESVLKTCSYTSVSTTPDGKTTFAVGSDKTLKEVADSQVSCQIKYRYFFHKLPNLHAMSV